MKKQKSVLWDIDVNPVTFIEYVNNIINDGVFINSIIPLKYSSSSYGLPANIIKAIIIVNL